MLLRNDLSAQMHSTLRPQLAGIELVAQVFYVIIALSVFDLFMRRRLGTKRRQWEKETYRAVGQSVQTLGRDGSQQGGSQSELSELHAVCVYLWSGGLKELGGNTRRLF